MPGRPVMVGSLGVGNGFPVRVESMLKTPLQDLPGCLEEARSLAEEGCELVRVAFPEVGLSRELSRLVESSPIEVMADIHFDHRLAIRAIDSGCRSVRINPGNMGGHRGMSELSRAVRDNGVVVRIGANSGSLSRSQMEKAGGDVGRALFDAVSEQVGLLLDWGVEEMILSAKSSSIKTTLRANSMIASTFDAPIHRVDRVWAGSKGNNKELCRRRVAAWERDRRYYKDQPHRYFPGGSDRGQKDPSVFGHQAIRGGTGLLPGLRQEEGRCGFPGGPH